ncbi:hypothetical protein CEXT_336621 [Caerostris extrusa]|uniref:Uncharacterized protein n=1 Tax=Caerostris extrusa TaxID=172846 RepID=A0AAV4XXS2_CAEEX|nr:hypothetical protein CEXT_336621 [Caerostris extrusa]
MRSTFRGGVGAGGKYIKAGRKQRGKLFHLFPTVQNNLRVKGRFAGTAQVARREEFRPNLTSTSGLRQRRCYRSYTSPLENSRDTTIGNISLIYFCVF